MKRVSFIAIAALTIITAFYGGYTYGKQQFSADSRESYDAGYAAGKKDSQIARTAFDQIAEDNSTMREDYNNLVDKYNQLVGTSQQRQQLTCNTYNYDMLNSSTTRCW